MKKAVFSALGAALLAAALAVGTDFAPPAHADPGQAGLSQPFSAAGGPYIGKWGAHGEGVTVNSDGTGIETSRYGTVNFKMSSVSTDQPATAYGNVVSGGNSPVGSYVTMVLVDGGNGMLFSMGGGDNNFPFCKVVEAGYANNADCGA